MTEEILTCSICFEIFKNPKMLPCQHTFCKHCLLSLIQKKSKFYCPLCRKKVLIGTEESSEELFPTNYLMSTLLESYKNNKDKLLITTIKQVDRETQTNDKQNKIRTTRTIGTEMKRRKTANITTQTKRKRTRVQNADIQTDEIRLQETVSVEIQTVEETRQFEDVDTNAGFVKGGAVKCKHCYGLIFTVIGNIITVLFRYAKMMICLAICFLCKLFTIFYSFIHNVINLTHQAFLLILQLGYNFVIIILFRFRETLTSIKEGITMFIHFLKYTVSVLINICYICTLSIIFIYPFCFAYQMQVLRPEIKIKRPKMRIIRPKHKNR